MLSCAVRGYELPVDQIDKRHCRTGVFPEVLLKLNAAESSSVILASERYLAILCFLHSILTSPATCEGVTISLYHSEFRAFQGRKYARNHLFISKRVPDIIKASYTLQATTA